MYVKFVHWDIDGHPSASEPSPRYVRYTSSGPGVEDGVFDVVFDCDVLLLIVLEDEVELVTLALLLSDVELEFVSTEMQVEVSVGAGSQVAMQ